MSSIIKVNTFQDANGNALFNSDGSGTVTLDSNFSGVLPDSTPAFEATLSANQGISSATDTKVQFNTETYDTDNCYDNSTNYRFTPTTAGKYYVYSRLQLDSQASSNFDMGFAKIYKNGARIAQSQMNMGNNNPENVMVTCFTIVDMNGSSDYLEIFGYCQDTSGTPTVRGASYSWSCFGAYRIIGA